MQHLHRRGLILRVGFCFLAPGSWLPTPGSCLPTPGSWLLAPGSWLLAPGSWLLAPGSWLLAPGSWLLAPGFSLHPTPSSSRAHVAGLGVLHKIIKGGHLCDGEPFQSVAKAALHYV